MSAKTMLILALLPLSLCLPASGLGQTPLQPTWTYQGSLTDGSQPADGAYDLQFTLWDAPGSGEPPTGGNPIGGVVSKPGTTVAGGLFSVQLNEADEFGPGAFNGEARWLQIEVNGTALAPRQPLTPAPFALFALNAAAGGPWAVNGTGIYNTNAGNVGVGTPTPGVQLDVNGDLRANARVAFGNAGIFGTDTVRERIFDFSHRLTDLTTPAFFWTGLTSHLELDPSEDASKPVLGQFFHTTVPATNTRNISTLLGCDITCDYVGTGTLDTLRGAAVFAGGTGVVDQQTGLVVSSDGRGDAVIADNRAIEIYSGHRTSGGSVTDDHGLYVHTPSRNSPLTNHYGIYLENQGDPTAFPTSYAIYADGGQSFFGDAVGIGISSPAVPLHVTGGLDAALGSGGFIVTGAVGGLNIALDDNEIMARDNGSASDLYLNHNGGDVLIAGAGLGGRVGVGVTAPAASVDVANSGSVGGIRATTSNIGIRGIKTGSGTFPGVQGETDSTSSSASGVRGFVNSTAPGGYSAAVRGVNNGTAGNGIGVHGSQAGSGWGVYGTTPDGVGVYADSNTGYGVYAVWLGNSNSTPYAYMAGPGAGVYGFNRPYQFEPDKTTTGYLAGDSYGVYGAVSSTHTSGYAGYFSGRVRVNGDLTATGVKPFTIDHPLDPEDKLLRHFSMESPEVLNVYSGNVLTDGDGLATVTLPDYFEAINRDFRYQLTVIGQFAQAIVAEEISGNSFAIRTNKPGVKVSWQVSALRNDPYMRANPQPAEIEKEPHERGKYLQPELYGQPPSRGVDSLGDAPEPSMAPAQSVDTRD
ncbi:MAG: hypothetical protein CHACPFDD_02924 [Phycisphaerae bacterium]|nr:hypothetical protein [Phycisphaerae bacterium]